MGNPLLKEIENCRQEMIQLSNVYGLTSQVVIQSSKRLDELLNKYQRQRATY
ncbi:MAG TPA: aspartyl-phosphate phosphatase Spo0E family protein [Bacillota bacterium]|nr:aspartyl-phosphate phosphatase Spo0E family protein [Bacillota bacterium]